MLTYQIEYFERPLHLLKGTTLVNSIETQHYFYNNFQKSF